MQDYIIATSSTADLPREYLEEHQIPFISYTYTVNGEIRQDDCREESRDANFKGMRAGDDLKTSMINAVQYEEYFRVLLDSGRDVIFLDMSEKMSASFANANAAAEKVRKDHPGQRLCLMDTRCISGGLGLLVQAMVKRKEAGASFDEVLRWGEENKLKIAHRFTVDDLNYLKKGGRVSNASALVGSLLSIKPVLYVPDRGTLDVVRKVRGRRAALTAIRESVLNDLSKIDTNGLEILILHADCMSDAEWVRSQISQAHPETGEITIGSLGVVIGAHVGPGLIAVFYFCQGRVPD
ncbi:MAG: DegV family protein [Clostridia bacterium]|nr:DegV family protein [Clostridia bacterium]